MDGRCTLSVGMLGLAALLFTVPSSADDRGGDFDVVLEGGALFSPTSSIMTGSRFAIAPVGQVVGLARFRFHRHFAFAGGLSALPVPQVTAFGALGRLEWLPLSTSDPLMFEVFTGLRALVVQPITCAPAMGSTCSIIEGGGGLAEIGLEVRSPRFSGYRLGFALSGEVGSLTTYSSVLFTLFAGATAGVVVTF
jgi:hypothetical protein